MNMPTSASLAGTDAPAEPGRFGLTIGPVLYHWPRQALMDFYAEAVETPADTIVIGEVVCARRRELRLPDWLALGADLAAAGKTVVLAAQALIETEADLRLLERQAEQTDFAVEAADASALHLLAERVPLVLGPHLNIYSRAALVEHAALGAGMGLGRWVAPVELPLDDIAAINPAADPVCTRARPSRPRPGPSAGCRWPFRRVASQRATTTCPRISAASAASRIRTAWRWTPARRGPSWCSTARRPSRPRCSACSASARRCAPPG